MIMTNHMIDPRVDTKTNHMTKLVTDQITDPKTEFRPFDRPLPIWSISSTVKDTCLFKVCWKKEEEEKTNISPFLAYTHAHKLLFVILSSSFLMNFSLMMIIMITIIVILMIIRSVGDMQAHLHRRDSRIEVCQCGCHI